MFRWLPVFLLFVFSCTLSAQNAFRLQASAHKLTSKALQEEFERWESYRFSSRSLLRALNGRDRSEVELLLGGTRAFHLLLEPADLLGPDYHLRIQTEGGPVTRHDSAPLLLKGQVAGRPNDRVRLTLDEGFVLGFIQRGEKTYYLEPAARYVQDREKAEDVYILYEEGDVKPHPHAKCTVEAQKSMDRQIAPVPRSAGQCYEVDIALAADYLLVQEQGSVGAAESEILGILNNVQGNYDDEFADQVIFQVPVTFISSCSTCDPWTSSTNVDALLPDFRSWGNGGGFGTTDYDLASLWTDRNFNGSTIGYAYVGGVCGSARYNINQHFTNSSNLLRVLQAHELGHNLNAIHDLSGSPYIMAPAVQNTSIWSNNSINDIDDAIAQVAGFCFVPCGQAGPPTAEFSADVTQGCAPLTVQFSDESQGSVSGHNWSFPGGTPASSTAADPTVVYNAPGIYPVTLTVSNANGSDALTKNDYIQVQAPPIADFSFNTSGLLVSFTNTSANGDTYSWNFGDGNFSTEANPLHTYANAGTYVVTLTVTNNCGTDALQEVITVFPPVEADFTYDNAGGCPPQTVQFTDQSLGNVATWQWTFPGGTPATSTAPNPTVVYNTPGTYDVTLQVSDGSFQDTKTVGDAVAITAGPAASFDISYTPGDTDASFSSTASNATTFLWDFGNGQTASGPTATFDFGTDGSYTVLHVVSNACGSDTAEQVLDIITAPSADFDASIPTPCAPTSVQFTNQSSANAAAFSWSFPGGSPATSTEENPQVFYNQPGTYPVTLEVSNAAGTDELTKTDLVVLGDGPVPGFTFSGVPGQTTVSFANNSQNADSYNWDFGGLGSSTAPSPTFDFPAAGVYAVTLTATNSCGSSSFTDSVFIVLPPVAAFDADQPAGCVPLTVTFSDLSSGGVTSRFWNFPGGTPATSTATAPLVQYDQPGSYDVSLIVSNAAGQDTLLLQGYVEVNGPPQAGFNAANSLGETLVSFTSTSSDADDYLWDFAGLGSSTLPDPDFDFPGDGQYDVQLIVQNDCGSDTISQQLAIVTPPQAGFSADQTSGCVPLSVQFSDLSSPNTTSWSWSFPGGSPASSSQPDPVVTYAQPGLYDVQLIAGNAAGADTVIQQSAIQVQEAPQAGFDFTVNGTTIQFTSTSTSADTYAWDFGDGNTSSQASPLHAYQSEGDFAVSLTVSNPCGSDTFTDSVSILFSLPTVDFSADVTEGCAPLTVQFSNASSANATSLEWTFEGGDPATSTAANPIVTFPQAGTWDVSLKAINGAGASTMSRMDYIVVHAAPEAAFQATIDGPTVQFANQSLRADSVRWLFGDGASSTLDFPEHTYAEADTFEVFLIAFNACGSDTASQAIVLQGQAPMAGFSMDVQEGCAPLQVQFSAESQGQVDSLWWDFGGGTPQQSSEPMPLVRFDQAGIYYVNLSVQNAWGTSVAEDSLIVLAQPESAFDYDISGNTVDFTSTSSGGNLSHDWRFGDGNTSSIANPRHIYDSAGVFRVQLIVGNSCGLDTLMREVDLRTVRTSGPVAAGPAVRLFPNPSPGVVWLEMSGWVGEEVRLSLVSALGQVVQVQRIPAWGGGVLREQLDWSRLPAGLYVIRLESGKQRWQGELLISD